jgi:hypothetical protein
MTGGGARIALVAAVLTMTGLLAPVARAGAVDPSAPATGNFFGYWVSVSGTTAMFGAPFQNSGTGAVYVYSLVGGSWVQQAVLTASDAAPGDAFGRSVVVSGTTAVVGAPFKTSPTGNIRTGAAYVFTLSGGTWTQQAKLLPPGLGKNATFGRGIALAGSTIAVGAPGTKAGTGAAYVYAQTGGVWAQQAKLVASDGMKQDDFGKHLAVGPGTVVVGAPHQAGAAGAAYVFTQSGTHWTQQAKLVGSDVVANDNFGRSVSLSGSSVLIGADSELPGVGTGAAYVFTQTGGVWTQQAKLTASDAASTDNFGRSVALQGGTAVVGAPYKDNAAGLAAGAAYVYTLSGGVWTQQAELVGSDTAAHDDFGRTVALDGTTLAIGAPQRNALAGGAYLFSGAGASWTQVAELP